MQLCFFQYFDLLYVNLFIAFQVPMSAWKWRNFCMTSFGKVFTVARSLFLLDGTNFHVSIG